MDGSWHIQSWMIMQDLVHTLHFINSDCQLILSSGDKSCKALRFRGCDQYLSDELTGCVSPLYHFQKGQANICSCSIN